MKARIPNIISLARLLAVPVLACLAWLGHHTAFACLLLPALASDVVDGWLARRWNVHSPAGARLDSVADIALMGVMLFAIWPLHPVVYQEHGFVIYVVVGILVLGHLLALIRFGHLASFHTWLLRIGIMLFSLFAVVLFLWGFQPWLLYVAAFVCALGGMEQLAMILLMPEWRPDVRGGLVEVLRQRRAKGR